MNGRMNVKQRDYKFWTTAVLGTSTTEERGGCGKTNSAIRRAEDTKAEYRSCKLNTSKRNRGRTFRLFGDEQPLEGSNVTCLEYRRVTSMETIEQTVA
jgi:hypothetical protein